MAIRPDVAIVLAGMGFDPIRDFDASRAESGEIRLNWRASAPRPTDAEIDAAAPAILAAIAADEADKAQAEQDRLALKRDLQTIAGRLTQIRDASSFTTAQLAQAVRDLAGYQLRAFQALRRLL